MTAVGLLGIYHNLLAFSNVFSENTGRVCLNMTRSWYSRGAHVALGRGTPRRKREAVNPPIRWKMQTSGNSYLISFLCILNVHGNTGADAKSIFLNPPRKTRVFRFQCAAHTQLLPFLAAPPPPFHTRP